MIVTHRSGFFSCYTVILYELINYFNNNNLSLPETLDTSKSFDLYKSDDNIDITNIFFDHYDNKTVEFQDKAVTNSICNDGFQKYNYKNLAYIELLPFIQKYFNPTKKNLSIEENLLLKYKINLDNCIALYYRGTDKYTETPLDSFDSYYNKLIDIVSCYENMGKDLQIIVQTDSAHFLDFMKTKLSDFDLIIISENAVSYTDKGIYNEKCRADNFGDIHFLFSTVLIFSKCKHLICSSGNVSVVMMFYRFLYKNSIENIHQNYNLKWL